MAFEPSTMVIVAVWPFTAAPPLPALAVPEMVTPTAASLLLMMLSPAIGVVIAIVGAVSATVITCVALVAALPAASDTCALMPLLPLPDTVTPVLQAPPLPTVAVPTWVVTPFTVSNRVAVEPTAASPTAAVTVPEIVCVTWLVVVPAVLIVTVGASVSSATACVAVGAALPAASETLALML